MLWELARPLVSASQAVRIESLECVCVVCCPSALYGTDLLRQQLGSFWFGAGDSSKDSVFAAEMTVSGGCFCLALVEVQILHTVHMLMDLKVSLPETLKPDFI